MFGCCPAPTTLPPFVIGPETPATITVESFIGKLESHRNQNSATKWSYTSDGALFIDGTKDEEPLPPLDLSNEEFAFLLHSMEEKRMSNWIITGLENEVTQLKLDLDREKQLHLATLGHLERASPSSMSTLLREQMRLRAALRDSRFQELQLENDFLKTQIAQFTSELYKAQESIQALRLSGHSGPSGSTPGSTEQELREQLDELEDNYRIQEFELTNLKVQLEKKQENILDLEEHLKLIQEDSQVEEFIENQKIEDLKAQHANKVVKLEKTIENLEKSFENYKSSNPYVKTDQPDREKQILQANFQKVTDENSKIREKFAILQMEHACCAGEDRLHEKIDELEKALKTKTEEQGRLMMTVKEWYETGPHATQDMLGFVPRNMYTFESRDEMAAFCMNLQTREMEAKMKIGQLEKQLAEAKESKSKFESKLRSEPKTMSVGSNPVFDEIMQNLDNVMNAFETRNDLRAEGSKPKSEPKSDDLSAQNNALRAVIEELEDLKITQSQEISKLQKINLEFAGEISKLMISLDEREKMIASLAKTDSAHSLKSSMEMAQLKFDLAKAKDELAEKKRELEKALESDESETEEEDSEPENESEPEDEPEDEEGSEDSDGWSALHGSDADEPADEPAK